MAHWLQRCLPFRIYDRVVLTPVDSGRHSPPQQMLIRLPVVGFVRAVVSTVSYSLVLGCEQKSVENRLSWTKLCVCNANYAAQQPTDANFW